MQSKKKESYLSPYQVNKKIMKASKQTTAIFMHCLAS